MNFKCAICGYLFDHRADKERHEREDHEGD
jgi:rubredoxin